MVEDDPAALHTDRLLLRRTLIEDLSAYREVHEDPETSRYRRTGPATAQECAERVEQQVRLWDEVGLDYWTVIEAVTGEVLGFGGLRPFPGGELNLYYRFRPSAWGKGYAYEMARAAVDWAATHRSGDRVVIWTQPVNARALALAERLGFVRDGSRGTDDYVEWSFHLP